MKVKCSFCKTYVPKEEAISQGIVYFCSEDHMWEKHNSVTKKSAERQRVAPKKKPRRDEPSAAVRRAVNEADGGQCAWCGSTQTLVQHHIKYRSEPGPTDHSKSNLITLCTYHHLVVHTDKRTYKKILLIMTWLRDGVDARG